MLGLSLPYVHSKQATAPEGEPHGRKIRLYRASKTLSLGNQIFPGRNSGETRVKHTSWSSRKGGPHVGDSQNHALSHQTLARPASNSGMPKSIYRNVDTNLESRAPVSKYCRSDTLISFEDDTVDAVCSESPSRPRFPGIQAIHRSSGSQGRISFDMRLLNSSGNPNLDREKSHDDSREDKRNWLSQLRGWIPASKHPTWALKRHTKGAFRKAGVALRDLRASAEFHLSVVRLPPEATTSSKPQGFGPELEGIAMGLRGEGKDDQQLHNGSVQMSRGSQSSTSQSSSLRSAAASSTTNDTEHWN